MGTVGIFRILGGGISCRLPAVHRQALGYHGPLAAVVRTKCWLI